LLETGYRYRYRCDVIIRARPTDLGLCYSDVTSQLDKQWTTRQTAWWTERARSWLANYRSVRRRCPLSRPKYRCQSANYRRPRSLAWHPPSPFNRQRRLRRTVAIVAVQGLLTRVARWGRNVATESSDIVSMTPFSVSITLMKSRVQWSGRRNAVVI